MYAVNEQWMNWRWNSKIRVDGLMRNFRTTNAINTQLLQGNSSFLSTFNDYSYAIASSMSLAFILSHVIIRMKEIGGNIGMLTVISLVNHLQWPFLWTSWVQCTGANIHRVVASTISSLLSASAFSLILSWSWCYCSVQSKLYSISYNVSCKDTKTILHHSLDYTLHTLYCSVTCCFYYLLLNSCHQERA